MTSENDTKKDVPSLEVLSELCRHYDTTLWSVTSLWAAAIGGLLVYNTEHFDMWLSIFGMGMTVCAFFFAASFRKVNAQVQEKMPEGMRLLFRSPPGFRQWNGFLLMFLSLDVLWVMVLTKNMHELICIWAIFGAIAGGAILCYWYAAKGKGCSGGA
ncbi:MAG: hypothetical protein AABY54_09060 [Deltaproteobacteria bacterium]